MITMLYFWRGAILDNIEAATFTPDADMVAIVNKAAMTSSAKTIFYASSPILDGTQSFNTRCGDHEMGSATLGCYVGDTSCNVIMSRLYAESCMQIVIYNVANEQLDGIKEVTAAHEMLHAAYARLSESERNRVDTLLKNEVAKRSSDEKFANRMAVYSQLSETESLNELHSILGTEQSELSPDLATYYERYFTNRKSIVAMYNTYETVFSSLKSEADALANSLNLQAESINQRIAAHNVTAAQLQQDISDFNARATTGRLSSQAAFNAERASLQTRATVLEKEAVSINDAIARYNNDRDHYQTIAGNLNELNNSIDSSLAPAPAV